jgi:hypothetical protein
MTNAAYTGIYDADTLSDIEQDISWARSQLTSGSATYKSYKLYKDYLDGDHRVVFDTAEHEADFRAFIARLRCNVCPAVVAALTDRLKIESIEGDNAAAVRAWDLWQDLHLAAVANRVHTESAGVGDAYVLVWPDDEGVPRPYVHTALEMCHEHDEEKPEIVTKAAKLWKETSGGRAYWRLTLYYPDRIEKYRSITASHDTLTVASFAPYEATERATGMAETWPLENPYGVVPVFHFPHDADTHRHGRSALRDVLPLQDDINQNMINRAIVLDFGAYPLRILAGVESDIDSDPDSPTYGQPKQRIRASVDRLLTFGNSDVKALQFEAAATTPYDTAINDDLNKITVITGIPPHHFQIVSGDFPSGEALKTSESRLVSRVEDAQIDLTADWSRLLAFLLLVDGMAGARVRPVWASAHTRQIQQEIEIAATKVERIGVPQEQVWKDDLRYTDDKIAEMRDLKQAAATPPAVVPAVS